MAKKTIEPSYQTLSDLAELFGSCVYQAPSMQSYEKLDEAVLPKENKIFTGRTELVHQGDLIVHLDNGPTVGVRNITGLEIDENADVMVMQNTSGEYILFAGGGVYADYSYTSYVRNAPFFEFYVVPYEATPNSNIPFPKYKFPEYEFDVIDTDKLINMISELRLAIEVLIDHFDLHTHTTPQGATATPTNPIEPAASIRKDIYKAYRQLYKSKSSQFSVKYPKNKK